MEFLHRNGETEPPTEAGLYWFKGKIRHPAYAHDVAALEQVEPHWSLEGYENWIIPDEECIHFLTDATGQWWGPVLPPWNEEQVSQHEYTD